MSDVEKLKSLLSSMSIEIRKYDPEKYRCVFFPAGAPVTIASLAQKITTKVREADSEAWPKLTAFLSDHSLLEGLVQEYAEKYGQVVKEQKAGSAAPEYYHDLQLNIDESHQGRDIKYFVTQKKNDRIFPLSGHVYMKVMGLTDKEITSVARKVFPEYAPRSPSGVTQKEIDGIEVNVLNTYVPPKWKDYKGKLPDSVPQEFRTLVNHLFPLRIEREYFFNQLYASMFTRSYVYLILCGAGGVGKNTLKQFYRALHGPQNAVDGKKSTLTERFNGQMQDATLTWFDEITYSMEMENVMKELQNDTISIEKKNYDATRSTKIYTSFVISNNKPRDNYIAFDARKFAPLVLNPKRLDTVMNSKEINRMLLKIDETKPEYDNAYVAQIARWVRNHGWTGRWPTLEYKGPMFYKLAHTSMSRWQKRAASAVMETEERAGSRVLFNNDGFLWSTLEESVSKKGDRSSSFPDYTTVQHFFDIFVDANGDKGFQTVAVPDSLLGDFYVKCLKKKMKIITEAEVIAQVGDGDDEIEYDL